METGECRFKIGDGLHSYKDLPFLDEQLRNEVDLKVSKEDGKALSSNDFTDELKTKLNGIATGAQVNTITGIKGNAEFSYRTGNVNLTAANIGAATASHTHNYAGSTSAGGVATSATKLATSRTIRTNLASTSTASFNGTANITPGITGTLAVSHGGTGATTTALARSNLSCASDDHYHVAGQVSSQTTIWSGTLNPGNSISLSNANTYALVMVEVECGQFRATRIIYPNSGGYWCAVALPNNTQVVFQATTGTGSSSWKIHVDTTTSSGGKVISVVGLKFKTTAIYN